VSNVATPDANATPDDGVIVGARPTFTIGQDVLVEEHFFAEFREAIAEQQAPEETDGRRLRRSLNRQAVVDALLDLYDEGNLRPSTDEIAERAGISPRSLFRYFEDTEDLARDAMARQQMRVLPLLGITVAADASLKDRIQAIVDQRLRLFSKTMGAATVHRLHVPFNEEMARHLVTSRAILRSQVRTLFTPELTALSDERAEAALATADVLLSFESYCHLTSQPDIDNDEARTLLCNSLSVQFSPGGTS
jgi:hypothetical protein